MKQTAAYYRSSTKLQEDSVNTQQFNVTQFALAKGYFIDKEYQDPYVSARKNTLNERPKMNELIQDIKKGKIERLLVYKRDRLARKIEEHLQLYYLFKDYNVEVIFVAENEPAMQFNIFGELMELFIGVMNQREGEQILERISDAKLNSFLTGAKQGNLPFGYEVVDNQISKKEEELKVVADIFKDWNTNEYKNLGDLERVLQAKGVKRGTANWTRQNLEDALTNPIYMGMRVATFKDQEQKRFINDINCIKPEDFYKAQELLVERTRKNQKRQPFLYLLSGLLYCQKCAEKNNSVRGKAEQSNQSENKGESTSEQSNQSNDDKGSKAKKGKYSSENNIVLKPLKNDVRTRQNEKYPTYECKEHKVVLDAKDTEDLLLKKSISFFKQLSATDFDKLYGSQLKENLKQIKARKGKQQTELEKLEEKLLAATKKWVKQKNEANKAKLLECSEEVKSMKDEMTNLEMLKNEIEDIPKRIKDIEKNVLSERTFNQLSFIEKQDLMTDIISKVMVDDISIQIVFKHPFLERTEVLA